MRTVLSDAKLALLQELVKRLDVHGQKEQATALRILLVWQERDLALNEAERRAAEANKIGDDMLPAAYHDQLAYYADQMAFYAAQSDIYKASIKLAQDTVASVPSADYAPENAL
jgi:hypothetical protein